MGYFAWKLELVSDILWMIVDIKTTRRNQQFKTSVYRKPTLSGVFTHYESYLDQTYKKSLIYTLLCRCFSVCSDYSLFHLEVKNLSEFLKKKGYLSGIMEQSMKSFLNFTLQKK